MLAGYRAKLKVNSGNTSKRSVKCSNNVVLVSLLSTLNNFYTLFRCFHCKIWTSTCRLGMTWDEGGWGIIFKIQRKAWYWSLTIYRQMSNEKEWINWMVSICSQPWLWMCLKITKGATFIASLGKNRFHTVLLETS